MATITLTLPDGLARRIEDRAAERGQKTEEYLVRLVERAESSYEEWKDALDEFPTLVPEDLAPLPNEAFRRETMYR